MKRRVTFGSLAIGTLALFAVGGAFFPKGGTANATAPLRFSDGTAVESIVIGGDQGTLVQIKHLDGSVCYATFGHYGSGSSGAGVTCVK